MSKFHSSTLLCPIISDQSADRLLDDCALDHTLGVLRRSLPRTYAGRFRSSQSSKSPSVLRRGSSAITCLQRVISSHSLQSGTNVSRLALHAAFAAGFVTALAAIFVSILQTNDLTAHAASGFISFVTVTTVTLLLAFSALHLLAWLGVDIGEFVANGKK